MPKEGHFTIERQLKDDATIHKSEVLKKKQDVTVEKQHKKQKTHVEAFVRSVLCFVFLPSFFVSGLIYVQILEHGWWVLGGSGWVLGRR